MSSVDALTDDTMNGGNTPPAPTPIDTGANDAAIDAALAGVWDRENVTNGADRGDNGQFVRADGTTSTDTTSEAPDTTNSLEGGEGEGDQSGSTPATDIPLPAFLKGKEALWGAVAPEQRAEMAAHLQDLNVRMSRLGTENARYQPLMDVAQEFSEYWQNMVDQNGQPMPPAEGVRYLANIQRSMDRDPLNTLLSIADTYNLRADLAKAFGGQVQTVPQDQQVLLREIAELKEAFNARPNVSAEVDQAISRRDFNTELNNFAQSKPLWNHVAEDMPFFIQKAKTQLGEGAGRAAVLNHAYDLAVQADPALRKLIPAASAPDQTSQKKAEGARRAASVNAPSSIPGRAREKSLDDELEAVWENNQ